MERGSVSNILQSVLIVDDNPVVRQSIRQLFISAGVPTCFEARDGKEAIDKAAEFKPDLIILDLSMPVMNGLQAAPVLRQLLPKTPIILFTMYDHVLTSAQIAAAGVSIVVSKSRTAELVSTAQNLRQKS